MANLTQHLTSISPDLRSGPSPGRRLLALVLCAMLAVGSTFPGFAVAGEADSEGEGTAPPVEAPLPPNFDPGGEETGLEEVPASGGEEGGAVEAEPAVDTEAPVTGAAAEAGVEEAGSQPVEVPEVAVPAPEPVQQKAPEPVAAEPVANQSLVAPKPEPVERRAAHEQPAATEAAPPAEPAEEEAPPPPAQPAVAAPVDSGRNLSGKDFYVVRPGDCLWHIAAALLPADATTQAIANEVERLWRLNEGRIGTGDPDLIYAGTTLRLR